MDEEDPENENNLKSEGDLKNYNEPTEEKKVSKGGGLLCRTIFLLAGLSCP